MRVVFRLLTPFVIVTVAAFGFTTSAGAVNEFGDVQRGRWYAEPIAWLVGEGITNGTSEGCFSPYAQITRGQVVTFLYRLDQTRDDTEASTDTATSNGHPFVDVVRAYQQQPVSWAFAATVTTGTTSTTFAPDQPITRGDFAVMLWRYAGRPAPSTPHPFDDVNTGYQQTAISWMAETSITTGTSPTTFTPDGNMTRAEAATFLHRFMDRPNRIDLAGSSDRQTEPAICLDDYESVLVDAGLLESEATCVAPFLTDLDIDTIVGIANGTVPLTRDLITVLSEIITADCIPTVDRQAFLIRAFL